MHGRHGGKQLGSMLLKEIHRRSADSNNQIELVLGKEGAQIFDERPLCVPKT
jgi:hypothetical protein